MFEPGAALSAFESIKHKDACYASTGSSVLLIVDFRYTNALRRLAARLFDQECVKSRKRGAFVDAMKPACDRRDMVNY